MKTIACSNIGGGECPATFTAETPEEAKGQASAHAKEAHAEMVAAATEESMAEWNKDFDAKWEALPDNA